MVVLDLTALLQAFGQSTDGNAATKRQRLKRFIGITTEV